MPSCRTCWPPRAPQDRHERVPPHWRWPQGESQSPIQVAVGVALIGGAFRARAKRYTAHGICQAAVLVLNLITIALVMWPCFFGQVLTVLPKHLTDPYYSAAAAHAIL